MNVVDSSAWLEYFAGGPGADHFADPITKTASLIVPTIILYEVFRVVLRQRGEDDALQAAALLQQGRLVDLTPRIALEAASLGHTLGLPMADAVILATTRQHHATLWTQDEDFQGLPNVRYFARK